MSTVYWRTGVSGLWSNGADWSNKRAPNKAEKVVINAAGSYVVTVAAPADAYDLTIDAAGATLAVGQNLTAQKSLSLIAGTVNVTSGGTLAVNSTTDSTMTGGALFVNGGTLSLKYLLSVTGGVLTLENAIVPILSTTNPESGYVYHTAIDVSGAGRLIDNGTNALPTVTVENGGVFEAASNLTLTSVYVGTGGTLELDGQYTLNLSAEAGYAVTAVDFVDNGATLIVSSFTGVMQNFEPGDVFDLREFGSYKSISYANGVITIGEPGYKNSINYYDFYLTTNYTGTTLAVVSDRSGGFDITLGAFNAQTITLTSGVDNYVLGPGNNVINAAAGTLSAGDSINAGGGANDLVLNGAGVFDLTQPALLSGIAIISASEAAPGSEQIIDLRAGLTSTVNVASSSAAGAGITIVGAANSDVINLGTGADVVYAAGNETIHNGTSADLVYLDGSDVGGAVLVGTSSASPLRVEITGTVPYFYGYLNAADNNVTIQIDDATYLDLNQMQFVHVVAEVAGTTISMAAAGQSVTTIAGGDEITAMNTGIGNYLVEGTADGLNNDLLNYFSPTDQVDVLNIAYSQASLTTAAGSAPGTTVISLTDGTQTTSFTMVGSYTGASWHMADDTHGGTLLSYHS